MEFIQAHLVNAAVLVVLALSVFLGYQQGLIKSGLMLCGTGVSLLGAKLFYPSVAHSLGTNVSVMTKLTYYAEESEGIGGIRISSLPAVKIPSDTLERIIAGDWVLPHVPLNSWLGKALTQNIEDAVFAEAGAVTLGDYLKNTIAQYTVNLISFVTVFAIIMILWTVAVYLADSVIVFPVLKAGDSLLGAALGLVGGWVVLNVLFMLVPAVLNYLPVTFIREMISASSFSTKLLEANPFLSWIPGYIS